MNNIALTVFILALVAVLGLWIGNWKIKNISLGIGGVLFGGIIIGHYTHAYHIDLNPDILQFTQEFGLILFVYSIGIQVGPGFFSSLRRSGLRLNLFATLIVILGGLITILLYKLLNIPLPIILGIFSGAVTNTPALGAAQYILTDVDSTNPLINQMGMAYAIAYPFGICGILLSIWLIRIIFKIDINDEANFEQSLSDTLKSLQSITVKVCNPNLAEIKLTDIPTLNQQHIICSHFKRDETLIVPNLDTTVKLNDCLHLVGDTESLAQAEIIIGQRIDVPLTFEHSDLKVARIVVTNEKILGKRIKELNFNRYHVVISRVNRSGVELVANTNLSLNFGDILNIVGKQAEIDKVASIVGNTQQKLQQVQMLPVFIGIALGVLLGSIPIQIHGFPAALRLGLAGGPLVVALILGRIGRIGKLHWFMPPSANLALRELGIVLFLSIVGLKSGANFIETLLNGSGISWMGYGILITIIPLLTVGIIARLFTKINYLSICGMLAGSMTDPPALAFANAIHPSSGSAALSYATVYPLVMFLRIMTPQLIVLLFWS